LKAVLVAPVFDEVTQHSYSWSRAVREMLEGAGWEVIDISGRAVSREEVEEALRGEVTLYVHYDHGSSDAHWGASDVKVIDLNNVALLSGRECYNLNCLSAKRLGVEAWKRGARAYWGYIEEFAFSTDALTEFGRFVNEGLRLRLEGKSWAECLRMAKELARELASKLVDAGKYIAAVLLSRDAEILVCYTPENPPESRCPLRRLAIKLFGPKIGWSIPGVPS
jgi:hypothetical protein